MSLRCLFGHSLQSYFVPYTSYTGHTFVVDIGCRYISCTRCSYNKVEDERISRNKYGYA